MKKNIKFEIENFQEILTKREDDQDDIRDRKNLYMCESQK
jgi:hypothetical protein